MKTRKKWKRILLCSAVLLNMVGGQLLPTVEAFAEGINSSEMTEITQTESSNSEPLTADTVEETTESTNVAESISTPNEVQTLATGAELAQRINPMDIQGLTNEQINELANVLYGDMAKIDPTFGMSVINDKGETVPITFNTGISISTYSSGTSSENIYYDYQVTKGSWSAWGAYFQKLYIDEKLSYCVQPGVVFIPGAGFTAQTSLEGLTSDQMFKINKYINFGAKDDDSNEFYVATTLAIWEDVLGWNVSTNLPNYGGLKNKITQNIAEFSKLPSFNGKEVTVKVGESITVEDTNGILNNFKVQTDGTNSKIEKSGNKLTITPSVNSKDGDIDVYRNSHYSGSQYFYVNGNGSQAVSTGGVVDPTYGFLKVKVIKLGNATFKKVSELSNLPMEGVTYKVMEDGKAPYEMKTDANGELNFKDRLHGSKVKVQEIANPLGYFLDPTVYELTIEGATTVSQTLVNNVQRGKVKLMKQKTVLDVEATKEKGEPVYKKVPLAGAKFNIVAESDIKLPDGKTILAKAGTVVDTITTDSKGYAESTKELFVGKANVYRLVEVNVPEGYRAPSEDQTLFTIPNGNNTEKLIVYDLGTIDNELQTGKFKFQKQDSDDLFGVAGARITVKMLSGLYKGEYFTFTTKAEGNEFELPVGDWEVTEIKLPNNYGLDPQTPPTQLVTIKDNETVELKWNNKRIQPIIKTLFATVDGKKVIDPTVDNKLKDVVGLTNVPTNVPVNVDTEFVVVDENDQFLRSLGHVEVVKTFEKSTAEFDVLKDLPKNTLKDGERLVATHIFRNEDKTIEYGREYNLSNKDQTVFAKKPVVPTTPTKPTTPQKAVGTFPQTGEKDSVASLLVGLMAIVAVIAFSVIKKRKESTVE